MCQSNGAMFYDWAFAVGYSESCLISPLRRQRSMRTLILMRPGKTKEWHSTWRFQGYVDSAYTIVSCWSLLPPIFVGDPAEQHQWG
jgi:hypothetical protein